MTEAVKVGDGFTRRIGTDADPWTAIAVSASGKTVTVQADKAELDPSWKPDTRPGGFVGHTVNNYEQRWVITPDPAGATQVIRLCKRGWQSSGGTRFTHGQRSKFYDYNF